MIRAFKQGYETITKDSFDFLVKLDCDLRLPRDYFEELLRRFKENSRLGIASGVYLEEKSKGWVPVRMPAYHAAGAGKMIRKECFEEIGGFEEKKGWDTVDEIRARFRGWETCHFTDLEFYHLKPEGTGMGLLKTAVMRGEIFFLCGGTFSLFLIKALKEMIAGNPKIISGLAMTYGFFRPLFESWPKLVSSNEAKLYRGLLKDRLVRELTEFFRITSSTLGKRL